FDAHAPLDWHPLTERAAAARSRTLTSWSISRSVPEETRRMTSRILSGLFAAIVILSATPVLAQSGCAALPNHATLRSALISAVAAESSGLNLQMWATIVDRDGVVCAVAFSGAD